MLSAALELRRLMQASCYPWEVWGSSRQCKAGMVSGLGRVTAGPHHSTEHRIWVWPLAAFSRRSQYEGIFPPGFPGSLLNTAASNNMEEEEEAATLLF